MSFALHSLVFMHLIMFIVDDVIAVSTLSFASIPIQHSAWLYLHTQTHICASWAWLAWDCHSRVVFSRLIFACDVVADYLDFCGCSWLNQCEMCWAHCTHWPVFWIGVDAATMIDLVVYLWRMEMDIHSIGRVDIGYGRWTCYDSDTWLTSNNKSFCAIRKFDTTHFDEKLFCRTRPTEDEF